MIDDDVAKKYGWSVIEFRDGTKVAFCSGVWNSALQKREINAALVDHWSLYGSGLVIDEATIARARAEFNGDHRYRIVKKLARRSLNERKRKDWDDVIRGPVRDWAIQRIAALVDGELCVDNDRVALKGNTAQTRRYMRQKNSGCCGSSDIEDVCPIDGKTYLLGCNFGH